MIATTTPAASPSARSQIVLGARLAVSQPVLRGLAIPLLMSGAFTLYVAVLERQVGSPAWATEQVLTGAVFGLVVPLLAGTLVIGGSDDPLEALVRHGTDRRLASLGAALGRIALSGVVGAGLGASVVLIVRLFASDTSVVAVDLLGTGWTGILAGVAYVSFLAFGSRLGLGRWGALALLGLDWILGSGTGVLALAFPRAHVRNLLGGDAPLALPQGAGLAFLVALSMVWLGLYLRRIPR